MILKNKFKDVNGKLIVNSNIKTNQIKKVMLIIILLCALNIISLAKLLKTNLIIENNEDYQNNETITEEVDSEKTEMQVFIDYNATEEEIENLGKELNKIEGIENITLLNKEDTYNEMQEKLKRGETLQGFTVETFSISYKIVLKSDKLSNEIYNKIYKLDNVREIKYVNDNLELKNDKSLDDVFMEPLENAIKFIKIYVIVIAVIELLYILVEIYTILYLRKIIAQRRREAN